jgi:hypothetical protein
MLGLLWRGLVACVLGALATTLPYGSAVDGPKIDYAKTFRRG